MVEITASYPAGVIGKTLDNLQAAASGEHEEWAELYPHFADVAEAEGFPETSRYVQKHQCLPKRDTKKDTAPL